MLMGTVLTLALVSAGPPLPAVAAKPQPEAAAKRIAWRPFEAAAFETARKEKKLVLLSMPAPWGHWDHIMDESTFIDPKVVELVTTRFVPVRVDPLLRPDLFLRYGMGAWPTTAFLLPSAQPFYFADASRNVVRAGG